MNNSKNVFGGIAVVILIIGILLLTGVFGSFSGVVAVVTKAFGIGCIVIGALIAIIVIAVVIVAFKDRDKDENADTKKEINQIISSREQDIAKLKSNASVSKIELRRIEAKLNDVNKRLDDCDRMISRYEEEGKNSGALELESRKQALERERDNLNQVYETYLNNIHTTEKQIADAHSEVLDMKTRRDVAMSKMSQAQTIKNNTLGDFEDKAQYEEDYANALKELNKK